MPETVLARRMGADKIEGFKTALDVLQCLRASTSSPSIPRASRP